MFGDLFLIITLAAIFLPNLRVKPFFPSFLPFSRKRINHIYLLILLPLVFWPLMCFQLSDFPTLFTRNKSSSMPRAIGN
jgi:hypothetical protein